MAFFTSPWFKGTFALARMTKVMKVDELTSLAEAQGNNNCMEGMRLVDYGFIMKNNIWDLVDRPQKHMFVGTKWVYS